MMESGNGLTERMADTEAGRQLVEKLSDERTIKALDQFLDQIELLNAAVQRADELTRDLPVYTAIAVDTVDEVCRQQTAKGDNVAERIEMTAALVERITRPDTLRMLGTMLDFAERLPGMVAMSVDIADEQLSKLVKQDGIQSCITMLQHFQRATKQTCSTEPVRIRGIFGWWRSTRDPHFQRGLGFFAQFLKYLGQSLEEEDLKKRAS